MATESPGYIPPESPEKPHQKEKEPQTPEVEFLFVRHTPEYAKRVAERIKDADLILIEEVGARPLKRREIEDKWNEYLSRDWNKKREEEKIYPKAYGPEDWKVPLLERFAGSGKRLKLIDISAYHPIYEEDERIQRSYEGFKKSLRKGNIEKAYESYRQMLEKFSEVNPVREEHVVDQLAQILPQLKDEKVVVIQGALHTPTYHMFKERFPQIKSKLSFDFPEKGPERFYSYLGNLYLRTKRFFPQREYPEEEHRRDFVGWAIFAEGAKAMIENPDERIKFIGDLAQKLSPDETEEIFDQFPSTYNEVQREYRRELEGLDTIKPYRKATYTETAIRLTKAWAEKKEIKIPKEFRGGLARLRRV